jgi:hypothetical protein
VQHVCVRSFGDIVIDSVSPAIPTPGDVITVQGTGFGKPGPLSLIRMTGAEITGVLSWTNTTIVALVPSFATSGLLQVVVYQSGSNFWSLEVQTLSSTGMLISPHFYFYVYVIFVM